VWGSNSKQWLSDEQSASSISVLPPRAVLLLELPLYILGVFS
jgi:hypothetical protein